jgi:hypothetical protein
MCSYLHTPTDTPFAQSKPILRSFMRKKKTWSGEFIKAEADGSHPCKICQCLQQIFDALGVVFRVKLRVSSWSIVTSLFRSK